MSPRVSAALDSSQVRSVSRRSCRQRGGGGGLRSATRPGERSGCGVWGHGMGGWQGLMVLWGWDRRGRGETEECCSAWERGQCRCHAVVTR